MSVAALGDEKRKLLYFWKEYNAVEIVANGSVAAEKIQEQDLRI